MFANGLHFSLASQALSLYKTLLITYFRFPPRMTVSLITIKLSFCGENCTYKKKVFFIANLNKNFFYKCLISIKQNVVCAQLQKNPRLAII